MQATSATWDTLWASGAAYLESKAVINGVDYSEISTPIIDRALTQSGLSIGNAVSATCNFSLRTSNVIPKSASVVIKMRLSDGTTTSEWLNAGTFYIAHRTKDPITGILTLECYDSLLKANADMPKLLPWTDHDGNIITTDAGETLYFTAAYPRKMSTMATEIALLLGVEIDPRTQVSTGDDYVVSSVIAGTTIHDVLSMIAEANGGNWIMTHENKLRLVPITSAANAASAVTDVVDVDGILDSLNTSNTGTISGIRYVDANENKYVVGDETGIVLDVTQPAAIATALAQQLIGMTYQAYDIRNSVYNPATELGDYIRAGANGEISSVIYSESASLGLAFRGALSAPEIGELSDEYPYIGTNQKTLALAKQYSDETAGAAETSAKQYAKDYADQAAEEAAVAAADNAVQAYDNTLTQQEIFDRLTDGGQTQGISLEEVLTPALGANTPKKIYLNVDFVNDGTMSFSHLRGETLRLGGINNANGEFAIYDASGNLVGTWDNQSLKLGSNNNYVQLYGPTSDPGQSGQTVVVPLLVQQAYNNNNIRVMIYRASLFIDDGTNELWASPNSIKFMAAGSGEPNLQVSDQYFSVFGGDYTFEFVNGGDLIIGADNVDILNGIKVNGVSGASGSFTTKDNKTVTVTNGIITRIA